MAMRILPATSLGPEDARGAERDSGALLASGDLGTESLDRDDGCQCQHDIGRNGMS